MFHILDQNEADLMLTLDNHVYRNDYIIAWEEPVSMHFVTGVSSPYATERELSYLASGRTSGNSLFITRINGVPKAWLLWWNISLRMNSEDINGSRLLSDLLSRYTCYYSELLLLR